MHWLIEAHGDEDLMDQGRCMANVCCLVWTWMGGCIVGPGDHEVCRG